MKTFSLFAWSLTLLSVSSFAMTPEEALRGAYCKGKMSTQLKTKLRTLDTEATLLDKKRTTVLEDITLLKQKINDTRDGLSWYEKNIGGGLRPSQDWKDLQKLKTDLKNLELSENKLSKDAKDKLKALEEELDRYLLAEDEAYRALNAAEKDLENLVCKSKDCKEDVERAIREIESAQSWTQFTTPDDLDDTGKLVGDIIGALSGQKNAGDLVNDIFGNSGNSGGFGGLGGFSGSGNDRWLQNWNKRDAQQLINNAVTSVAILKEYLKNFPNSPQIQAVLDVTKVYGPLDVVTVGGLGGLNTLLDGMDQSRLDKARAQLVQIGAEVVRIYEFLRAQEKPFERAAEAWRQAARNEALYDTP